jgi:hypothetical protein
LIDIEKRRADRLRVMKAVFDTSGGSETVVVRTAPDLQQRLGLSFQELADACNYLVGEGLIVAMIEVAEFPAPIGVQITHKGIDEMEQTLEAPTEPTQHFPPAVSVINIHGSVIGSPIQSGSPGAQQEVSVGDLNLDAVHEFLGQYAAQAAGLDLPVAAAEEMAAEIDTVKAQLRSPKPKHRIIRESLHSIRAILENASGGAAAVDPLDLLQQIHL